MGKRLFLSLIAFLMVLTNASATGATVTIDGIKYYYEYTRYLDSTGGGRLTARVLVQDGKSKEGAVEIPSSIVVDGDVKLFVTAIDDYAFSGNKNITKITIPGCVVSIGGGAFRECSSLEEVVVQTETNFDNVFLGQDFDFKGLTHIYGNAFAKCTGLRKINFPVTLKFIGNGAFMGCTGLTSVELPDGCTSFGISYIFDGCTSLRTVSLPDGISIPINAFSGCVNLETVTLRGEVNEIGDNAFMNCFSMELIDLRLCTKLNITSTERKGVFNDVPESTIILLPVDNKEVITSGSIAANTYANNTTLQTVVATSNVSSIADGAFSGCSNLELLDLSAANVPALTAGALSGLSEKTVVLLPTVMSASDAKTLSAGGSNIVYKDGDDYKSESIRLTDGEPFNAPASITSIAASSVAYVRSFSNTDVVYSICLPYDQPVPEGLKAYELDELNNEGALVFREVNAMNATNPYLVTSSASVTDLSALNVVMDISSSGAGTGVTGYTFCGTLRQIPNDEASSGGYLILQSDKKWHPIASGTRTISANRAYLKPTTSGARISGTVFVDYDGTTSIETIDYDGTVNYYNLQGLRINKPTKGGIYVRDGRKSIMK